MKQCNFCQTTKTWSASKHLTSCLRTTSHLKRLKKNRTLSHPWGKSTTSCAIRRILTQKLTKHWRHPYWISVTTSHAVIWMKLTSLLDSLTIEWFGKRWPKCASKKEVSMYLKSVWLICGFCEVHRHCVKPKRSKKSPRHTWPWWPSTWTWLTRPRSC